MENTSLYDYSSHVHKVLLKPDLLCGIGMIPVFLIAVLTLTFMCFVSIYCIIIGIILFVIAKQITKKDAYTLQFLGERLMMPTIWRA